MFKLSKSAVLLTTLALGLPVATAGGAGPAAMAPSMTTAQTSNDTDVLFMEAATMSNLAEIATSRLALQKSGNAAVRAYAQKMITEHTKAQNELNVLAARKGIRLTDKPGADQRLQGKKLSTLSGAAFDAEYKNVQVAGHDMTLMLIKAYRSFGQDADVLDYAAKTQPIVAGHLELAQALPSE